MQIDIVIDSNNSYYEYKYKLKIKVYFLKYCTSVISEWEEMWLSNEVYMLMCLSHKDYYVGVCSFNYSIKKTKFDDLAKTLK